MVVEIDQSIKVEQTSQDTILAMVVRDHTRTILIPAKVKQEALQILMVQGKSRNIAHYQLFAIGLYILLKPHLEGIIKRREQIVIDIEYPGQDDKIKGMLLRCIYQGGFKISKDSIYFAQVGKYSEAHQAGWNVQRGKVKAEQTVDLEMIESLI